MSSGCPLSQEIRSAQKGVGAVVTTNSGLNPGGLFLMAAAILATLLQPVRGALRDWLPAVQANPVDAGPQGRPR
jgi:hypothetical protein